VEAIVKALKRAEEATNDAERKNTINKKRDNKQGQGITKENIILPGTKKRGESSMTGE
jgi:hypothetical protein